MAPTTTTIIRDANSVALLSSALAAMSPASGPPITDISVKYSVSEWSGNAVSGLATESSVGLFAHLRSVTVDGVVVSHTLLKDGIRTSASDDGISRSVSDRRAIEHLPYQPVCLLQELLLNPSDEIRPLPASEDTNGEDGVRVTVRLPNWKPEQRDLTSATVDLYFAQSTHLLSRIEGMRHIDGHPMHTLPYSLVYGDYQSVPPLLLPLSIEERIAGKSTNVLSVTGVAINQGMTISSPR
ncbi:hypothetical protein HDF16_006177 [Granulicella aggregans]|uniref:Uncharacterized protein n=1 Tax=Granulicella aggregans TaxID=474949 RepID=A0A7W8E789_9BACT|nr:hypothetical protein [Granulicella aggregans]MBB5061441.1 hypothetical protein [Granulicella aggregans]